MSSEIFAEIFEKVRAKSPLIHCITNYVTVNDCANILLAGGASPIMADDAQEVAEITALCAGLVLNIGTLNTRTIESMLIAGEQANRLTHPIVFDPVGAGASTLRTKTAVQLLDSLHFSVIRGNASEIRTLSQGCALTRGVDAAPEDAISSDYLADTLPLFQTLARTHNTVVAVTGATDVITDGKTTYLVHNGHPMMSKITGTGCMLTCLIAAFCAADTEHPLEAAVSAIGLMGLCGELAFRVTQQTNCGNGTFRMALIDAVSTLTIEAFREGVHIEKI